MYNVIMSEKDILSTDELTGNIVLSAETFDEEVKAGDLVRIMFEEDPDTITHEYTVSDIDRDADMIFLSWVKQIGESLLTEAPKVALSSDDMFDPHDVNFKDLIRTAQEKEKAEKEAAERAVKQQELKAKNEPVVIKLQRLIHGGESPEDCIDAVFDDLIPPTGMAETVGGEILRAIMRIIYRDYNDGDKFFEGYGLETCASSAEYLYDMGFSEDIQKILDNAYRLTDDDDAYTDAISLLTKHILTHLANNPELFWTQNTEDSRNYNNDYIVENQPTFELEFEASDDVSILVDRSVLTAWDLNNYVESELEWEPAFRGAQVETPWSSSSTSVTVTNLTKEGYELLHDRIRNSDAFWEELVTEHADELENLDSDYDDEYEEE